MRFFRMTRRLAGLVVSLLLVAMLAGCGSPKSRARRHYKKGLLYAKNYRLREAEREFKKALSLEPNNHETHYELARVYFSQRRLGDAESSFRLAAETAGEGSAARAEAYVGLADVLYAEKKVAEAIQVLSRLNETAIEEKPGSSTAFSRACAKSHGLLGNIYRQEGEADKAIAEYRKALEMDPGFIRIRCSRKGKTMKLVKWHRASWRNSTPPISRRTCSYRTSSRRKSNTTRLSRR